MGRQQTRYAQAQDDAAVRGDGLLIRGDDVEQLTIEGIRERSIRNTAGVNEDKDHDGYVLRLRREHRPWCSLRRTFGIRGNAPRR